MKSFIHRVLKICIVGFPLAIMSLLYGDISSSVCTNFIASCRVKRVLNLITAVRKHSKSINRSAYITDTQPARLLPRTITDFKWIRLFRRVDDIFIVPWRCAQVFSTIFWFLPPTPPTTGHLQFCYHLSCKYRGKMVDGFGYNVLRSICFEYVIIYLVTGYISPMVLTWTVCSDWWGCGLSFYLGGRHGCSTMKIVEKAV